jgi:hypothetical protein
VIFESLREAATEEPAAETIDIAPEWITVGEEASETGMLS